VHRTWEDVQPYCSLPDSGRSGQEQPTARTTSDWLRGRIRPDEWLSCICSAQLFLSGSAKIGGTFVAFHASLEDGLDLSHVSFEPALKGQIC